MSFLSQDDQQHSFNHWSNYENCGALKYTGLLAYPVWCLAFYMKQFICAVCFILVGTECDTAVTDNIQTMPYSPCPFACILTQRYAHFQGSLESHTFVTRLQRA